MAADRSHGTGERAAGGLTPQEIARYSRHLVLPEVGVEGQTRLREASVLLVGAGGLGSPAAIYLAAAGVGRLGLVDFDRVDPSNLQRQVLYGTGDVGRPKTVAARERLAAINPHVDVVRHETRLDAGNARELVRGYDLVLDGTDNFATRYLVNDACVLERRPNVYGSIFRFEGQVAVFRAGLGPCYRCLYPEPPPPGMVPSCAEGGVLGVLPGVVGTLQAVEAIKLILGVGEPLIGRLLLFDALEMRFRELRIRPDRGCALCGDSPTITELVESAASCAPSPPAAGETGDASASITPAELEARLEAGERPVLVDVRSPEEWAICRLEGATLIPMPELAARLDELDRERELIVYCHVGMRSAMAAAMLRREGFARARSLVGGLEAWSVEIDPALPRY